MLIQACLNGSRRPGEHPALPLTPQELARDAQRVVAAGSRVLHIHPRNAQGEQSLDGRDIAAALLAIRAMRPGDEVLIYHSQGEAAIVGLARVQSDPRPDPNDPKSWVVDMAFVRRLTRPVTLREIKESHLFDDWALVRQGRLSTMSVPDNVVAWLKEKRAL